MGFLKPEFSMICQEQPNWCWAAVTAAVKQYPPPLPGARQCRIAAAALPEKLNCCEAPDTCDIEFSLRRALIGEEKLQQFFDSQVTFEVIQEQIDVFNQPVGARILWDTDGDGVADGAHFVVIFGCRNPGPGGVPWVSVKDPDGTAADFAAVESDVYEMAFEDFRSRYRLRGTWVFTYLVK